MQIAGLFCDLEQLMADIRQLENAPNAFYVRQAALLRKGV